MNRNPMHAPHNFLRRLAQGAEERPDHPVLILFDTTGQEQRFTYFRLYEDALAYATWLDTLELTPGDVVLLAFDHGYELVQAFFGACYAGMLPLVYPYVSAHLATALYGQGLELACTGLDVGAVLTDAQNAEKLNDRAGAARALIQCFPEDGDWSSRPVRPVEVGDWAYLQLTSGTSGLPKAIIVGHDPLSRYFAAFEAALDAHPNDVNVIWVPFFHDMGLTSLLFAVQQGSQLVSMPPELFIRRPLTYLEAMSHYGATLSWMPNFGFAHIVRRVDPAHLRGIDLSSLRVWLNGAELILPETVSAVCQLLAPCGLPPGTIVAGYGLAECMSAVTFGRPGIGLRTDHVSAALLHNEQRAEPGDGAEQSPTIDLVGCGYPLPSVEVAVLDDSGTALAERQVGQIGVRGPTLFSGYYRQPELTARSYQDGWLLTGDLGYLAGGELFVCGRSKDVIISGGANINPEMIEQVVMDVDGARVRRAASFGVTDPQLGSEAPVVVIELRKELAPAELHAQSSALRRRVRAELGVQLGDVRCVPAGWIGLTTSGKTMRGAVRKKYLAAGYRPELPGMALLRAAGADPTLLEQALCALVGDMLGMEAVQGDDNFFDLGGDSLAALRFILSVEEATGKQVPAEFFQKATAASLARLLVGETATAPAILPASAAVSTSQSSTDRSLQARLLRLHALPRSLRNRVRRRIEDWALRRPYFEGVDWLVRWYRHTWVQSLFYPRESHLVRQFAESMKTSGSQVGEEIALSLTGNVILNRLALAGRKDGQRDAQLSIEELLKVLDGPFAESPKSPYVTVTGAHHLSRALHAGSGVIVAGVHSPMRIAVQAYLSSIGVPLLLLSKQSYLERARRMQLDTANGLPVARAALAKEAYEVLSQGGLVGIAGDEQNPLHGIPVVIGDRIHTLTPGFAELAAGAGATVLSIHAALLADGRVQIEISPPLVWERGQGHSQAIESLVQAYGQVQTDAWRRIPSAVSKEIMAQHLACPQVDGLHPAPEAGRT
ncbi:MAG: AMP-binding protein [Caldilinea sp.]|nr:AMP-binding protein [Anaerolineales bacterium]MCO5209310.1 AMP-binding protein [Caldilinea sp.]